ncbi:helix-turn-helix transcriptional regulator [Syntrophomonas curvata]
MLKYMLLGALMERSLHGYQLKSTAFQKMFADFGINDGQLYPLLKKLEQADLIRKNVEHQEGAPSRHVYSITAAGRKDFRQWLESSEGEERSFRYDFFRKDTFFVRCNYIQYLDKETATAKIRQQMDTVAKTIADLQKARASMISRKVSPLRISILEYGIKSQETRAEWLNDFLKEVQKADFTPV